MYVDFALGFVGKGVSVADVAGWFNWIGKGAWSLDRLARPRRRGPRGL